MITRLLNVDWLARIVNYLIFGTWPAKPQPRPMLITRPPFGPGDPRYHVGFKVEDLGPVPTTADIWPNP